MPASFSPGQTDYIEQLQQLVTDVAAAQAAAAAAPAAAAAAATVAAQVILDQQRSLFNYLYLGGS